MQLSGTPAAFAVVLLLNLNHNLFQCQTESCVTSADCTLMGTSCQSGRGQCRKRRGAISRESSRLWRIFVLDTENLCSVSISKEMGPGRACVNLHLSPLLALPKAGAACSQRKWPFRHKPNSKTFPRIPCSWFLFKMVMIILFWNINGSTFGGG